MRYQMQFDKTPVQSKESWIEVTRKNAHLNHRREPPDSRFRQAQLDNRFGGLVLCVARVVVNMRLGPWVGYCMGLGIDPPALH